MRPSICGFFGSLMRSRQSRPYAIRFAAAHTRERGRRERRVVSGFDGRARAGHELAEEMQVVEREESEDEDLAREVQMAEVRARVTARAAGARALRIERRIVLRVLAVLDDDLPV